MLATHLLSKNVRIQITLPFQWLTVTIRAIKSNSLLLDSNKDSESSNITKRNIDYLDKAEKLHKRKLIGKELTKTAKTLTSNGIKPNEEIMETLLTDISNIQNKKNINMLNKISNEYKHVIQKRYSEYIKTEKNVMNISAKPIQRKHDKNRKLSVAKTLLRQQNERRDRRVVNATGVQRKHDRGDKLSVAETLLQQQNERRDHQDRAHNELSTIKTIKKHLVENMNVHIRTKNEGKIHPDMFKYTTLSDQQKTRYTSNITKNPKLLDEKQLIFSRNEVRFNLDAIFSINFEESPDVPQFSTWHACEAKELELITHPKNAFEEMIQWTNEGKLWKFPIDNEQDMKNEQNVHFSRHVFLERHLTEWCPTKGPLRHFMELVCVGLSKNPYMTIEEKEEHLMWYRDYFKNKIDLLQKLDLVE